MRGLIAEAPSAGKVQGRSGGVNASRLSRQRRESSSDARRVRRSSASALPAVLERTPLTLRVFTVLPRIAAQVRPAESRNERFERKPLVVVGGDVIEQVGHAGAREVEEAGPRRRFLQRQRQVRSIFRMLLEQMRGLQCVGARAARFSVILVLMLARCRQCRLCVYRPRDIAWNFPIIRLYRGATAARCGRRNGAYLP